jgi:hypothetical protein
MPSHSACSRSDAKRACLDVVAAALGSERDLVELGRVSRARDSREHAKGARSVASGRKELGPERDGVGVERITLLPIRENLLELTVGATEPQPAPVNRAIDSLRTLTVRG